MVGRETSWLLFVIVAVVAKLSSSTPMRNMLRLRRPSTASSLQMCIGTQLTPLPSPEDERSDTDNRWRTAAGSTIIPVKRDKFTTRPELITFDAYNTLIEPSQSMGRWYREALNTVCDMSIRLPRPVFFTAAFKKAYDDMSATHPCFGTLSNGAMTSKQWWFEVVRNTYRGTKEMTTIDHDELETILPAVFNLLYEDIFNSAKGWLVKEDVEYTLIKLKEWRDQGSGPKIGVISNSDNRLKNVLTELGLSKHLDFVLTSEECQSEKPHKKIFDLALEKARCTDPSAAYHIGESIDIDVLGAASAGWTPLRFHEWFDEDFPDWLDTETKDEAEQGAARRKELMWWGRRDTAKGLDWVEIWGLDDVLTLFGFPDDDKKPIATSYIRNFRDDE